MQYMTYDTPLDDPIRGQWITVKNVGEIAQPPYGWKSKGFQCEACDEKTWDGQNIGMEISQSYHYEMQSTGKRKRVQDVYANFWVCYECRVSFKLHS